MAINKKASGNAKKHLPRGGKTSHGSTLIYHSKSPLTLALRVYIRNSKKCRLPYTD